MVEEYFDVGDKLYFRMISPLGLFDCYAPNLGEQFWIAPENVRRMVNYEEAEEMRRSVPFIYQITGMVEIMRLGWEQWNKQNGPEREE